MERKYRGFFPVGVKPQDLDYPVNDYMTSFPDGTKSDALVKRVGYKTSQYYTTIRNVERFAQDKMEKALALSRDLNDYEMDPALMKVFESAAEALDFLPEGRLKGIIQDCPLAYEEFISSLYRLLMRVKRYNDGDREDSIQDLEKKLADVLKFENYVADPRKFPDSESDSEPVAKRQRA
jgi:hypothetical protein